MPIPHKYINTPDDAYEAETSYHLHFQLVSALISLDHIYNCNILTATCLKVRHSIIIIIQTIYYILSDR